MFALQQRRKSLRSFCHISKYQLLLPLCLTIPSCRSTPVRHKGICLVIYRVVCRHLWLKIKRSTLTTSPTITSVEEILTLITRITLTRDQFVLTVQTARHYLANHGFTHTHHKVTTIATDHITIQYLNGFHGQAVMKWWIVLTAHFRNWVHIWIKIHQLLSLVDSLINKLLLRSLTSRLRMIWKQEMRLDSSEAASKWESLT
jgi:hypothetical protein